MNREYKSIPFEVKDIDQKQGIFTGYFSSFNVKDSGGDTVLAGAFQKSFNEWGPSGKNRIKCLYQHDMFYPIGKPLVLKEDSYGAYHETKVAPTTTGKDVLVLIEEKVITEHSFGYATIKAEPDKKGGRFLKELKVFEYSLVTLGMNSETPVTSIKSLETTDQLAKRMEQVERILRKGELQSEDLILALEHELKQWQEAVKSLKEPEREVITVNTERKDFYGKLQRVSIFRDFWMYNDILQSEIWRILQDTNITAKQDAIATDIDAYKETIRDWVTRAVESGVFTKEGLQKLETARAEFEQEKKNQTPQDQTLDDLSPALKSVEWLSKELKAGRVLSDKNKKLVQDAISALQSLLDAADPNDDKKNQSTTAPSQEDDEAVSAIKALLADLKPGNHFNSNGAATTETNPETIQFVKDLLDQMKKQGVSR
ncbi:HK97 family phage prohead protease [Effusibacillus consociatus]|uniref:HK97 family phage prohead protease n=1 Tax=Effusibacillus consociatus TaxID=1117041 RepID=A0ABV9Q4E8_9BACL